MKRRLLLGRKVMTNLASVIKSRDITLPTKVHIVEGFSSSHVWMWELDHKEGWVPKNQCSRIVVLCWGPLMDRNLVVRSQRLESKRQKEADIPWFMQRTNKALDTGPASLTKASGALSRGWRHKVPSQEGLRSPGRKVSTTGLHAPENQPEKEREREKQKRHGDLSSDGAKVL